MDGTPLLNLALNCVRFSLEKNSLKRIEFAKVALKILRKRFIELFDFFQMLFSIENIKEKIPDILCLIIAGLPFILPSKYINGFICPTPEDVYVELGYDSVKNEFLFVKFHFLF